MGVIVFLGQMLYQRYLIIKRGRYHFGFVRRRCWIVDIDKCNKNFFKGLRPEGDSSYFMYVIFPEKYRGGFCEKITSSMGSFFSPVVKPPKGIHQKKFRENLKTASYVLEIDVNGREARLWLPD
jgi:hypothetical protein